MLDNYGLWEQHEAEIERRRRLEEKEEAEFIKADMEEDEYE